MQNLQQDLINLLIDEENLVIDNQLNKNKIIEAALKAEPFLINLLINNETFRKYFFQEVEKVLVFDKIKFQRFVNNKSFLPDSYTAFKNKIGLTINDESNDNFIKSSGDVVLAWPYKDCVLEGGQTKEDQKRNEIFWNETLAPESVDRLLDEKVFTNFKKYYKNNDRSIDSFRSNENLILKGNNLLVISSLLKTHRNKVQLIYIDPPYNTGGDANIFSYNNSFNHSTWLTFMKNRLSISKDLLSSSGFIAIAIDHFELGYLIVLGDEIFGRENRIGIISVVNNPMGRQNAKFFSNTTEYMLVYAKDQNTAKFNKAVISDEKLKDFDLEDDIGRYMLKPFLHDHKKGLRASKPNNWYPLFVSKDASKISLNEFPNSIKLIPVSKSGTERSWMRIKESTQEGINNGEIVAKVVGDNLEVFYKFREQQRIPTHWTNKKYNSNHQGKRLLEGIVGSNKFSFPKSLYTVKDTIKILSGKNDYILDFHAGSGTTGHAVIDLNKEDGGSRKFILVEQLDEHIDICIKRNRKIIDEGYFVYAELMKYNQFFIEKIIESNNKEEIISIYDEMKNKAFLVYHFNKDIFNKRLEAFKTASLQTMKHCLLDLLDKNQLYVNFSEIEDTKFNVSKSDKDLNYSFYKSNI